MVQLVVNGKEHAIDAEPGTPLLYVLRNDLNLTGPKFGCGLAQCGACTVHLDGEAVRSCSVPVMRAAGKRITTIEGLGAEYAKAQGAAAADDQPHPLQTTFIEEQAVQCGYCTTGMIMAAAALLRATPNATDPEIRRQLHGSLCRCGTHMRILRAIKRAGKIMAGTAT